MRRLLTLALIAFLTISISTCSDSGTGPDPGNDNGNNGGGDETTSYTVSVNVTPSDAGSISPSAEDTYDEGEDIELQANPNDEYVFTKWTGDVESSDNPHSLTVDQDYNITANFELKSYELTVNTEGEGTVSEEVLEQKSKEYEHGTVVELTANPAEGYRFVEWRGDISASDNPAQITIDDPKEVTAVFEKKSYALTINTEGEGAVAEEVIQQKSTDYEYGTVVKLTANPSEGWTFKEWSGANTSSDNPIQVTVDSPKEVTAVFEKKSHSLTINTDGEGSVTKNPDQSEYDHGSTVDLTAEPAEGYKFVEWQGDIEGTDNPVQITLDQSKEVTAVFEKKSYELTVNTEGEGVVSEEVVQQKTTNYEHGTVVKLTANPAEGWQFVKWSGANTSSDNPIQITVDTPKEITAIFEKKTFTVATSTTGEGFITKVPDQQEYEYNSTVELNASPAEGYEFTQWQGDATGTTNPLTLTVDVKKEIEAVFELKKYSISTNTMGEGSITKRPIQSEYDHGSSVYLTAEPSEGYKFVEWTGDISSTNNPTELTIDSKKEVTAVFEKKTFTLSIELMGEGSVTRTPDQSEYEYGTEIELFASASGNSNFDGWAGDISQSQNPITLILDKNLNIKAIFKSDLFAGGNGTETNPYQVSNLDQLYAMRNHLNSHFILVSNIDATNTVNWNNGDGFPPIGDKENKFNGTLNGNEYTIKSLFTGYDQENIGLFGYLSEQANISNLNLEQVTIDPIQDKGGAIAGYNEGTIKSSIVTGTIKGKYSGGIAGTNYGLISNIKFNGTTTNGGITSYNNGTIEKAYTTGKVTSNSYVGGIAAQNDGTIRVSKSDAIVRGETIAGGIAGENGSGGIIEDSYYEEQTVGLSTYNYAAVSKGGGLVGVNKGKIKTSYVTGNVYAFDDHVDNLGKFVGINEESGVIEGSYYHTNKSSEFPPIGHGPDTGLEGFSDTELTGNSAQTYLTAFNWDQVWITTNSYPALFWE